MAKFSVCGCDDEEGPNRLHHKRPRVSGRGINRFDRTTMPRPRVYYGKRPRISGEGPSRLDEPLSCDDDDEEACQVGPDEREEFDDDQIDEEEVEVAELQLDVQMQEEAVMSNVGQELHIVTEDDGMVRPHRNASITVTLTDPDVLDCPICLEPLNAPVYQCENGHIACSPCCSKLVNKCPSCCLPIGYNRCRALERVLESFEVMCRNSEYGCKETVNFSKKNDHEKSCTYIPFSCPFSLCNFISPFNQLSSHLIDKHSISLRHFQFNSLIHLDLKMIEINETEVILKEEKEGVLFRLNVGIELIGDVISVNCIGPPSLNRRYPYDLIARKGGISLSLKSFAETIEEVPETLPSTGFLLVPSDFHSSCGTRKLELRIKNQDASIKHN